MSYRELAAATGLGYNTIKNLATGNNTTRRGRAKVEAVLGVEIWPREQRLQEGTASLSGDQRNSTAPIEKGHGVERSALTDSNDERPQIVDTVLAAASPSPAIPQRFIHVGTEEHYKAGMRPVEHTPNASLHCCLGQCRDQKPLVTLQELIGGTGDYRPAELRSLAAKLLTIAEDAEKHPMGKGSFTRSHRRY